MTDWGSIMADVAKALLGEPNAKLSKGDHWRYRNKGSLKVDVDEGRWYDFEADVGGGVLELIEVEKETDRKGAVEWLKREGYLPRRNPGHSDRRFAHPISRRGDHANRKRVPQKPKPDGNTSGFARKLWKESEEIGESATHPFRRWTTGGDKPNVFHPWCSVPAGIRWSGYRGGVIIAGVFPLDAWKKGGIPSGEPVGVQVLAIDVQGNNRYCLGRNKDLRRCSYGTVSTGVFLLGNPTSDRVNIVEGIADALAVYSREPGAVLATLGSNAKLASMPDVIDWLYTRKTWIYPDNDENKASEKGTAALIDAIKVRSPDAKLFRVNSKAVGDDPSEWAKRTPFADIERYDFEEKSGTLFNSGLSWSEADRMAVQTLTLGREQ